MNSRFFFLLAFSTLFLYSCGAPKPTKQVPLEFQEGQRQFHRVCSNCHNSDAMGGLTKAPSLIDEEFLKENYSDDEIRDTILNGNGKMPSQKSQFSEEQITEIIKYLRYSQNAAGIEPEEDIEDEDLEDDEPAPKNS